MLAHTMAVWHALRDGIRRVNRAPAVLAAIWLLAMLFAWPIAMSSRIDTTLTLDVSGMPLDFIGRWQHELRQQTVERSVEFGAGVSRVVAEPLAFVDYESRWLVALTASYPFLAFMTLAAGGIIDRYARDRPTGASGVAGASGVFFLRFFRLGILMAVIYALAFRLLGRWPMALAAALGLANLVFDYAQIRAVVEDRRSMIGAIRASLTFLGRHGLAALTLYAIDWAVLAVVVGIYVRLGPGTGFRFGPDAPIVWTIVLWMLINQLYVVGRLWARMVFWASATALFQERLARPGYVARPPLAWPEATSDEALKRL